MPLPIPSEGVPPAAPAPDPAVLVPDQAVLARPARAPEDASEGAVPAAHSPSEAFSTRERGSGQRPPAVLRQFELVERVRRYKPDVDEDLLDRAYVYAMKKHGAQKRASGEAYITHPFAVAEILTDMHVDERTIVVALLHDTIEDTDATRAEIDRLFGEEVGALVEGLTKLDKLDLASRRAKQAENLRKLLIAISEDVRVLLVKLADRLHNMRTLEHVPEEKRRRIAEETMDIHAPLAGRMGMQDMREELEELSFRHLNPEAHRAVSQRLTEVSERNRDLIATVERELCDLLALRGIPALVRGRQKKAYSVFSKMEAKGLSFEQLSDIFGFRVLVERAEDCYAALGAVHLRWQAVPGRFKDYISTPKPNDYRSLHSTIVGPSRQRIELQIRTHEMNETAEYGVATHAIYKDVRADRSGGAAAGGGTEPGMAGRTNAYSWLRRTIDALKDGDAEEFLEHTKLELFQDQVFCFTPKAALIALPRGATPVDFAYAVHTDVGDTCAGAKVNGRIVPLMTALRNGDEVEIMRSGVQVPPAAWEEMVVTGKARQAIRRANRTATRRKYAGLGQRIVENAFERVNKPFSRDMLLAALPRLAMREVDDVLAAVGRNELPSQTVLHAIHPETKSQPAPKSPPEEGWTAMRSAANLLFKLPGATAAPARPRRRRAVASGVPIRGAERDLPVSFADTGAVPGDRIVGILDGERGITVYPVQHPALERFEDCEWIDVRWDVEGSADERFPVKVSVTCINEPGTLADIAHIVAEHDVNIERLEMVRTAADFTEMLLDLEVAHLKQLNHLLSELRGRVHVSAAERRYG